MRLFLAKVNDGNIEDKIENKFSLLEVEATVLVRNLENAFFFCFIMSDLIYFIPLFLCKTLISAY